jgi:NAD(P)-dependent dehydrogenase (short-subunit alcohol dehydrogenase family)
MTRSMQDASPLSVFAPGLFARTTALVTGGGRGIGRAIALAFADLGADVVIAGRREESLRSTAEEIEARGVACLAHPTNIRDIPQVEALVTAACERFGEVDFLVNNAGGQFPARPWEISDAGWRSVVDLNLNGTWNLCSRLAPRMARRGRGSIVNVVHIYSFERGAPFFAHSGAARAGVVNLTRTLAYYYARHGVTVNAVAPGSIETPALYEEEYAQAGVGDYDKLALEDIPAHRFGTPEEVAALTLYLCSPAGRYVNGAALVLDGAQSLARWSDMFDPESL